MERIGRRERGGGSLLETFQLVRAGQTNILCSQVLPRSLTGGQSPLSLGLFLLPVCQERPLKHNSKKWLVVIHFLNDGLAELPQTLGYFVLFSCLIFLFCFCFYRIVEITKYRLFMVPS